MLWDLQAAASYVFLKFCENLHFRSRRVKDKAWGKKKSVYYNAEEEEEELSSAEEEEVGTSFEVFKCL